METGSSVRRPLGHPRDAGDLEAGAFSEGVEELCSGYTLKVQPVRVTCWVGMWNVCLREKSKIVLRFWPVEL